METKRLQNLLKKLVTRTDRTLRLVSQFAVPFPDLDEIARNLRVLRDRTQLHLKFVPDLDLASTDDLMILAVDARNLARQSPQSREFGALSSDNEQLLSNCDGLINLINGLIFGLKISQPDTLQEILPEQKAAPYQFAFKDDRLVAVESDGTITKAGDLLEVLVEQSERIIRDLHGANCSPRLKEAFLAVHKKLAIGASVIQIGVLNGSCARLVSACADELSATLSALLSAHTAGVSAYVAQSPEWREFAANAIDASLDQETFRTLIDSTRALSSRLREHDPVIAPSVTEALDQVAAWADDAQKADGRIVLALTRTLENLASLVMRTVASVGTEIAQEGRKMVAKAVILTLVGAAAFGLGSAVGRIPGAEWLQHSLDYFAKSSQPK